MTASQSPRHPGRSRTLAAAAVVVASLLVTVWAAPRASGAAAAAPRTASVILKTLRTPAGTRSVTGPHGRGAAASVTVDAGMRFSMVGVVCDVPQPGAFTVSLRVSLDGRSWGPWLASPLEVVDEDGTPQAFIDPVWTGTGRYLQVRTARDSGSGSEDLTGVRIVAIDPSGESGAAVPVTGAGRSGAAAATEGGVTTAAPAIVTRDEWGADESLRSDAPSYAPVKMAFVHHTASANAYAQTDAPAIVRAIYAYHTKTLHWSDIGYNFLIDRFGTVYEGRAGGMASGVIGAQAGGFNTGSTGIAVLGTFTEEAPPAEAVVALERLLAWKLRVHGLDPLGTATLTCRLTDKYKRGSTVTFPVIAGHRQANYTECPGDAFFALLPAIRINVARRMSGPLVATLDASRRLISPNGDGVLDSTQLDVDMSFATDWRLTIRGADGEKVAAWSGQGASASRTWTGASGGHPVPDGVYTSELAATAADGRATTTSTQITVDTTPPRLSRASVTPSTFSPNGDGQLERATATYRPAEACDVRVAILDKAGHVVRWLRGWRQQEARAATIAWDGRVESVVGRKAAPDGSYRFDVERRDAAGNIARQGLKVTLDRTLAAPRAVPMTFSPNGDGARDMTMIGFTLSRRAAVTVSIRVGDAVVRTLREGDLGAGTHAAEWDGRIKSGGYQPSSRATFTVTADSVLGESAVSGQLVVDLDRPRVSTRPGIRTSVGTGANITYKVVDAFSTKADVSYVITDTKGHRVASGHPGWRPTGQSLSVTWKPATRGDFTVTFHALDLAGNHEVSAAHTVVTAR